MSSSNNTESETGTRYCRILLVQSNTCSVCMSFIYCILTTHIITWADFDGSWCFTLNQFSLALFFSQSNQSILHDSINRYTCFACCGMNNKWSEMKHGDHFSRFPFTSTDRSMVYLKRSVWKHPKIFAMARLSNKLLKAWNSQCEEMSKILDTFRHCLVNYVLTQYVLCRQTRHV